MSGERVLRKRQRWERGIARDFSSCRNVITKVAPDTTLPDNATLQRRVIQAAVRQLVHDDPFIRTVLRLGNGNRVDGAALIEYQIRGDDWMAVGEVVEALWRIDEGDLLQYAVKNLLASSNLGVFYAAVEKDGA
jgi:hypothetical protein